MSDVDQWRAVRWACPACDVLVTHEGRAPRCDWCGGRMVPGLSYKNPCSAAWANKRLEAIANEHGS